MTEPLRECEERLPVREADWDAARSRRALLAVQARLEPRRARPIGLALSLGAAGIVAVALLVLVWSRGLEPVAHPQSVVPAPVAPASIAPAPSAPPTQVASIVDGMRTLKVSDGSRVRLGDASTQLEVQRVAADRVELALASGTASFEVVPNAQRLFVVHAGSVHVEVVGTEFTVTRELVRVHVAVSAGRVRVRAPGAERELEAGEAAWFASSADAAPLPIPHAREAASARPSRAGHEKPVTARKLMQLADAARRAGDAQEALGYLRRVSDEFARDALAPLAAFTEGRLLLFELARPAEARKAFARARALSSHGALAEDALAREAEAALRAGDRAGARALSDTYLRLYPHGQRAREVGELGRE
jgi:transmembrane sensor